MRVLKSRWGQRGLAAGVVILAMALAAIAAERWTGRALRTAVGSSIAAVHTSQVAALRRWAAARQREARGAVGGIAIPAAAHEVLSATSREARQQALKKLHDELEKRALLEGVIGFFVVDASAHGWVYTDHMEELGGPNPLAYQSFRSALAGEASLSSPWDLRGERPSGFGDERPSMFSFAPLHGSDGKVAGVLGLRMDPARELSDVLALGRLGETGETYAFDPNGTLVSRLRGAEELRRAGVIHGSGILEIKLRQPTKKVEQSSDVTDDAPYTLPVRAALAGKNGESIDEGWLDYRGEQVIGAWTWLPEMRVGIVTKIDRSEAYAIINAIHWTALGLIATLALSGVAIMIFAVFAMRLEDKAAAVQELGQYKLVQKIGEGAMGSVYRATHSLLARPTALKLLSATTSETLQRFEREVKLTATLSHPNTIAIYDFGFNESGTFYYAMELLEGSNLESLVHDAGPLPVARALHIVRQVLGSLAEAHDAGLVHRDVKPANIMLTTRGGIPDFVKVLDFGLVRPVEGAQAKLTADDAIVGTPLYMAPEILLASDAASPRSDVYAVGGVLFYLLTGHDAFEAPTMTEIITRHLSGNPHSLSSVVPGGRVPAEIERLVSSWLAREASERPENARAALCELEALLPVYVWSEHEAWAAAPRISLEGAATLHRTA